MTYDAFPDLTADDQLLKRALESRGARVRTAVWSDPAVRWEEAPVTVMRSTWDYFHRVEEFARWLHDVSAKTRLINSVELIRWNMHKCYIADLVRRGVRTVPTRFVAAGDACMLLELCSAASWNDIVVKPSISGSAFGAKRFTGPSIGAAGQAHLEHLLATRDAMVQPYRKGVEGMGERALIFLGGRYSHGVVKSAFSAGSAGGEFREQPLETTEENVAFGIAVLSALDEVPAYARIDFVPAAEGLELMELELIEPSLHFAKHEGAANVLAGVLLDGGRA